MTQRESTDGIKIKTKELAKAASRIAELNNIIKKIYEDNISGKLNDELFAKFQEDYGSEHSSLMEKKMALEIEIEALKDKISNVQSFMELIETYGEITELTADIARRLIDRIMVHEAYSQYNDDERPKRGSRKNYTQKVQILLNCIGEYNPK